MPELSAKAIYAGMNHMKYDAVNVGEGEFSLGKGFFADLTKQVDFPFLSVNLVGNSAIKPYVIKQFADIKVGITGITAGVYFPDSNNPSDYRPEIKGHLDALKKILPELRKEADIVILLSHLGYQGTINLFRYNKIEGVDVAIAGHGRKILDEPMLVNDTLIVQNSMGGEYLGFLRLQIGEDGLILDYMGELIALTEDGPEDSTALEIMQDFRKKKYEIEKAQTKEKKQKEDEAAKKKYLKMSPQEFVDMMQKENNGSIGNTEPVGVPVVK